jgi:hypothetical protein
MVFESSCLPTSELEICSFVILKVFGWSVNPVGIVLLERMGGRGRVNPPPGTPSHADFNELLFVSIALMLTEISVDCDRS